MVTNSHLAKQIPVSTQTAFVSDIHLDPGAPERTQLFFDFLIQAKQHITTLYILGDLFEYWIGDDDYSEFATEVTDALKAFSQDKTLYFMRGNRDFIVGRRFAERTGATILKDPQAVSLHGKKGLLMHGDLLCTLDTVYLKTRAFYTHPITKFLLNLTPRRFREHKANQLRSRSKSHYKSGLESVIYDVHQPSVEETLQDHDATVLIHGHTHRPGQHSFTINNLTYRRYVLGDWYQKGNVLTVDNETLHYQTFEQASSIQF